MKHKKTIIALVILVVVIALMAVIFEAVRPKPPKETAGEDTQQVTQAQESATTEAPGDDTAGTTQPETTLPSGKTFTVTVVHGDGSEQVFTYTSDEDYLGTVILAEGLAEGEMGPYGLYIHAVDGERAVFEEDGAYWSLMVNGEYAVTGADMTLIEDGAEYSLVYTRG